jgi:hypothetical protein
MHEEREVRADSGRNPKGTDKKTKRNIVIGIAVGVIVLLFLLLRSGSTDPVNPIDRETPIPRPGVGVVLDGDLPNMSDEQIREHLKQKQDASLFTVAVNAEATLEKGSKILNLMVANPEKNSINCYFEIVDKEEVIYTSPIMKPKQYIQTAKLSKVLLEDTKKLIVRYNVVYQDNIIGVVEAEIQVVSKSKGV